MGNWALWQLRILLCNFHESPPALGSFRSKSTSVEMGIPGSGNSREPEEGDIGKNELDLGIEDSIRRCEMLLAMVPQAMEIYMANGSVFLFPWKKTKTRMLSCTENQSSIKPFFFLVLLQYGTPQPQMSLHCNSVLHQRAQSMHGNFEPDLCFAVKKHGEKKLNVLLIVPLDFQCDERAQETGFFFTNWNREFKTLILLSWFLLCLLSVDFCGSSKVMGQQEDVVAGQKKTAALTYLELCKDAKMRGGSRGEWESNMGLLSSSSYAIKDDSKTTNDNQDGKSLTSWVRKNRLLKTFFLFFLCW